MNVVPATNIVDAGHYLSNRVAYDFVQHTGLYIKLNLWHEDGCCNWFILSFALCFKTIERWNCRLFKIINLQHLSI